MYIQEPTTKHNKILMLRAIGSAISGTENPLFDVVQPEIFQTKLALFEIKHEAFTLAKASSQKERQKRDVFIEDIEQSVIKIAQYLKVKFSGNEKAIVDWGFPVLLGKRSGKIARKYDAENCILLYNQILDKHSADGESSALSQYNMIAFEEKLSSIIHAHNTYKQDRTLARIYAKQHQALLKELMTMARKIARNLRMREDMEPKDIEAYGFVVHENYATANEDEGSENDDQEDIDQAS